MNRTPGLTIPHSQPRFAASNTKAGLFAGPARVVIQQLSAKDGTPEGRRAAQSLISALDKAVLSP